ncbi:MAG: hypothetical protein IPG45_38750 [Deltaproteobacteria bacterium]|nr:hypothetical protein [Deltaproteobacteria bacterium]
MRSAILLPAFLLCLTPLACREGERTFRDSGVDFDLGFEADAEEPIDLGTPPADLGTPFDSTVINPTDGATDAGVPADGGLADQGVVGLDGGTGLEPGPGDLVFVEIQGNPQGTADTDAEYLELLNVSGRMLDLEGCRLTHRLWAGGTAPVDSVGNHRINSSVPVAPGARVLLARSAGGYFGGATRGYVYGGFEFSNGGSDQNRIRLMTPGWDGVEPPDPSAVVDEVISPAATFDNPLRGRAWQLDPIQVPNPNASNNDLPTAWCHAADNAGLAYWQNNWGTPGQPNTCN